MRNALIHGCREVDNATVWQTIQADLPALRVQVEACLTNLGIIRSRNGRDDQFP